MVKDRGLFNLVDIGLLHDLTGKHLYSLYATYTGYGWVC